MLIENPDKNMASIKILDSVSAEIFTAHPKVSSGLGKYLKGAPAELLAGADFTRQFRRELQSVSPGDSGFALAFSTDVPIGGDQVSLTVSAGSSALIGVYNRTGMPLFENTFVGAPVEVPEGRAYVAFAFRPRLDVGLEAVAGNLSFGFDAGTDAEFRCDRPFDLTGAPVTLEDACRQLLETFVIPNTVDDLKSMLALPVGTIASVSGHGRLQIGCAVDFAAAFNPLASVDTIAKLGALSVGPAASASVGFRAEVSGGFQVRVQTLDAAKVRLSYHKVAASELELSVDAAAGPSVTLGDRELLKMLFSGPGGPSATTEEDLIAAGVSAAQLDSISSAMRAGMSRKLSLEVSAGFSSMRQDEAAFLYEIDLAGIDAIGASVVDKALGGDLVDLNLLEPELPAHGISVLQSRTQALRTKQVKWRVNLVGIVNILSLTELARTGSVFHDEESGELVITDAVTSERVGAITESKQIRKLLYESVMLTATYRAGGLDPNTSLNAAQSFFHLDRSANRQRMSNFLDAVAAVGLIRSADVEARLGATDDFGRASLLLESEFDQAACERLFSDGGLPRDQGSYEEIGKLALLALVQARDPDAYRRIPLQNAALWKKMKDTGTPGFQSILPHPITGGDAGRETLRVGVVRADYSLIVWWAGAMAAAARALAEMRSFLNGPPVVAPNEADPEFRKRRDKVSRAMVEAVRKNRSSLGDDPWGLVALFYASRRSAVVTGLVFSPKLTMSLPERASK